MLKSIGDSGKVEEKLLIDKSNTLVGDKKLRPARILALELTGPNVGDNGAEASLFALIQARNSDNGSGRPQARSV